jgi:hypothetical protein
VEGFLIFVGSLSLIIGLAALIEGNLHRLRGGKHKKG